MVDKEEDKDEFEKNKGEAETLAGFILEITSEFPKPKEQINFNGYSFYLKSFNEKRIKQIKVTRNLSDEKN